MTSPPKHVVHTRQLTDKDAIVIAHPLNPRSEVHVTGLSDRVGMARAHLSLARVPPGKESYIPHSHALQEEFVFILSGHGTALIGERKIAVGPGDYMGFPTDGTVHHLINDGTTDLVYLQGGERSAVEIAHFPTVGKVMVSNAGKLSLFDAGSSEARRVEEWIKR